MIPSQNALYLDCSSLRLLGKVSIEKCATGSNDWKPLETTDAGHVTLINHWASCLWESMTVSIENTTCSFVASNDYPYKAWVEDVFSFSQESAKQQLISSGYLPDEIGGLDDPGKGGNQTRSKWLTKSDGDNGVIGFSTTVRVVFLLRLLFLTLLSFQLHCDLFNSGKKHMIHLGEADLTQVTPLLLQVASSWTTASSTSGS